jgi:hypothetical protein
MEGDVRGNKQGISLLAREGGEGLFNLAARAGVNDVNLQSEGAGRFRDVLQRSRGGWSICGIDQHGNANGLGHQIVQECYPLGGDFQVEKINAGRVPARPGQAGDETHLDWIFAYSEDDRGCRGRSSGCKCSKVAGGCGDDSHATTHEVSHEHWQAIELTLEPMVLHRHVLTLDVAHFVETLAERANTRRVERSGTDESDHRDRRLLRARRKRPHYRAAKQHDELAPLDMDCHGNSPRDARAHRLDDSTL